MPYKVASLLLASYDHLASLIGASSGSFHLLHNFVMSVSNEPKPMELTLDILVGGEI